MKLGGLLLLVTLIALSMEVQELQASVPPSQISGTCTEVCKDDSDCPPGQKCVSSGCRRLCVVDDDDDDDDEDDDSLSPAEM